jgi:hypothetical protein
MVEAYNSLAPVSMLSVYVDRVILGNWIFHYSMNICTGYVIPQDDAS